MYPESPTKIYTMISVLQKCNFRKNGRMHGRQSQPHCKHANLKHSHLPIVCLASIPLIGRPSIIQTTSSCMSYLEAWVVQCLYERRSWTTFVRFVFRFWPLLAIRSPSFNSTHGSPRFRQVCYHELQAPKHRSSARRQPPLHHRRHMQSKE